MGSVKLYRLNCAIIDCVIGLDLPNCEISDFVIGLAALFNCETSGCVIEEASFVMVNS